MAIPTKLTTAEELEQIPHTEEHVELAKGAVIVMPPAGHEQGILKIHFLPNHNDYRA